MVIISTDCIFLGFPCVKVAWRLLYIKQMYINYVIIIYLITHIKIKRKVFKYS